MADTEKRMIPISLPSTGHEEWEAMREPIFSGWITQGPKVNEFEKLFSQGILHDNSIVFNNLIITKKELESNWEIPLKDSWHKNLVSA